MWVYKHSRKEFDGQKSPVVLHINAKGDAATTNEELALRIKAGETELMATLWEQVEKYVRMSAEKLARKLANKAAVDADDFVQAGYFALLDAVKYYREDIGCSFIGVLSNCLKSAFAECGGWRTANGKAMWNNPPKSINEPIGYDAEGNELTLEDIIPCDRDDYTAVDDIVYNEQLRKAIDAALAEIPPAEAAAVRRYYLDDIPMTEQAKAQGVSYQTIRERVYKGKHRLRKDKTLQSFYYPDDAVYSDALKYGTEATAVRMVMGYTVGGFTPQSRARLGRARI